MVSLHTTLYPSLIRLSCLPPTFYVNFFYSTIFLLFKIKKKLSSQLLKYVSFIFLPKKKEEVSFISYKYEKIII